MKRNTSWGLLVGMFLSLLMADAAAADSSTFAAGPFPADTIRGRVTDTNGAALAGAEVLISELDRRVVTDAQGRFVLTDVPDGRYTLVFRRPGYAPVFRQVLVAEAAFLTVAMRETPFQVDAITVTATRSPVEALASPLPAAALAGERLERERSASLAEALAELPGVRNLSTGGQVGKPVIRGLTGARVLVLDDGLRVEDYSWGDEHGSAVDPRLAGRVEVLRGPASVLYGSDALGGVVNVIPEELPEATDRGTTLRGGFEAYGASHNREVGGMLRLEGARGPVGGRVALVGRRAGDLSTPEGTLANTGSEALSGEGTVGLRRTWGSLTLRYSRFGTDLELLGGEGPGAPGGGAEPGSPLQKLRDDRVHVAGNLPLGAFRLETKAQWERNWRREFEEADAPAAVDLVLNTATFDVLGHHASGERVRGTVGLSALYQDNDTRGEEALVPGARVISGALFAFEQATLGRWTLSGGARADFRRLDAEANADLGVAAQTREHTAVSGSLGLMYRATEGIALVGNVARGWRAPSLFELFTNGVHEGQARYEIGRADLRPERSLNVDLGLRWEQGAFRGEVAGYRNVIDDYIFIVPTGQFQEGFRVHLYDQARAVLQGGEVLVEAQPWHALTLRGRFDYVHGTNVDTDEPLPFIPPARADLEAEIHFDELSWADRLYLTAETERVAEQTRRSAFDVPTDGYGLIHFGAGLERRIGGWPVRVDVRVRNALDTAYRSYLSRYKEFALEPGRSVVLRVSAEP